MRVTLENHNIISRFLGLRLPGVATVLSKLIFDVNEYALPINASPMSFYLISCLCLSREFWR